jgi:hypothetical protein
MKLLSSIIVALSLALGGVALMKDYERRAPHEQPACPAIISLKVKGNIREVPFEVFLGGSCLYGTDGVSASIVP